MPNQHTSLKSPEEAAAILRISTRTLQEMRSNGTGPAFIRVGRAVLYPTEAINAWVEKHARVAQ